MMEEVNEARVAFEVLDEQLVDAGEDLRERHFADHETGDLLQQLKLMLGTAEFDFQLFDTGSHVLQL